MITDQIPQAPLGTQMNHLKGGGAVIRLGGPIPALTANHSSDDHVQSASPSTKKLQLLLHLACIPWPAWWCGDQDNIDHSPSPLGA